MIVEFSENLKKALEKIEDRLGIVPKNGRFVYKQTGAVVRKASDRDRMDSILDAVADTSLADVERMLSSMETAGIERTFSRQYEIPLCDSRLEHLRMNSEDYSIFRAIRVPYAEHKEASSVGLVREKCVLLYVHGNEATRMIDDNLLLTLDPAEVKFIYDEMNRYIKEANYKLLELAGQAEDPSSVHQELTTWLLEHVPAMMIPAYGKLKVRCRLQNKTYVPEEICGFVDPLVSPSPLLERDPKMVVANLKSISNDPDELAVRHFDLDNLPEGDTPAWMELSRRYTDEEWDVLKAYIYSIFYMKNSSRQALVIYDQGHSGKSCLFNTLQWAIGEANFCIMEAMQDPSKDKFYASHLYGKRLAVVPDCNDPCLLRRGWIHNFTGGDNFSIEFKNKNAFSAKCYGKVLVATNKLPSLDIDSDHIDTRLIILCPKMNQASLEILAQRDSNGDMMRDANGKVLLKGDNTFSQRLKDEFWSFLGQCKNSYKRLAINDETIYEPPSVRENKEIAQDLESRQILSICDKLFSFDPSYKILTSDFKYEIQTCTEFLSEKYNIQKIVQVLAENRGVVPCKSVRQGAKVSSGFKGLCKWADAPDCMDRILDDLAITDEWADLMRLKTEADSTENEFEALDRYRKICSSEQKVREMILGKLNSFFENARNKRDAFDPNSLQNTVENLPTNPFPDNSTELDLRSVDLSKL